MQLSKLALCAALALISLLPARQCRRHDDHRHRHHRPQVEVKAPVKKVILGEGRQIYFVAALDTDGPFKRVVGWRDDFEKADLDGYKDYLAKYPQIANLPTFGGIEGRHVRHRAGGCAEARCDHHEHRGEDGHRRREAHREARQGRHSRRVRRFPRQAVREHRAQHAPDRQAVRQGSAGRGVHRLPEGADRARHRAPRQGQCSEAARDDGARRRLFRRLLHVLRQRELRQDGRDRRRHRISPAPSSPAPSAS